jgi:hypothetical protein
MKIQIHMFKSWNGTLNAKIALLNTLCTLSSTNCVVIEMNRLTET